MTSFRDLTYRDVHNGVVICRDREKTVAVFSSINDLKKVYLGFWLQSDRTGKPYNFSQTYPNLFGFLFNCFVPNYDKEIRWSENGLCFITLEDDRILVGAPHVLMKKDD